MRGFAAVAIVMASVLTACSSSATQTATTSSAAVPASPLAAHGAELPSGQIPWQEVGPGWVLATWNPAPSQGPGQNPPTGQPAVEPTTLYLIDPAGGRYPITTFPPLPPVGAGDPGHTPMLADWSGDGRRALFEDYGTEPNGLGRTRVTGSGVGTGAQDPLRIDIGGVAAAYTRPTGQAILLSTFVGPQEGWTLERVDLTGTKQLALPVDTLGSAGTYNGAYLQSADGKQLVLGTAKGLVLMGDDGVVGKELPIPGTLVDCRPVRWWSGTDILAHCDPGASSSASQLWRVPVSGDPPAAVTAVNTGQQGSGFGEDLGDVDAWPLAGGTFLQSEAGCGAGFVSRLTADEHTTPVTIPGAADGGHVSVAGATGDELVLRTQMGCGSGISVMTFDPATNTTSVLLGPPLNGGDVQKAILYPNP